MSKLNEQVAIVTGAAAGIGHCCGGYFLPSPGSCQLKRKEGEAPTRSEM